MTTTEIYTLSLHDALPISDLAASAIRLSQPRWSPRRRLVDFCQSADLGGQLAHHISHVRRKLGVLGGRLALQRLERDRQFDGLHDPCAGDAERLAGVVVRPHPAVPAEGSADDR